MRWLPLLLMLVACLKPSVLQAPQPTPVEWVALLDQGTPEPAPVALQEKLEVEISKRGLVPQEVAAPTGDLPSLVVESSARFSSQINGRYRWTVAVTATITPTEGPPSTRSFTVPVHLVYYHDKEVEALSEAAPLIARQVGDLLDAWIRTL